MAKSSAVVRKTETVGTARDARSLVIARRGVKTGDDFAALMSAVMSDTLEGKVSVEIATATCNAGGKLLKVVEMQHAFARRGPSGRRLRLVA